MKVLVPILIGLLVVGCGKEESDHVEVSPEDPDATLKKRASGIDAVAWVSDPNDPNNVKIEAAIRKQINKPTGELTKIDSEKVTILNLRSNQLTDVKGLEKLAKLKVLFLANNQLIDVKGLEKLSQLIGVDLSDNPDLTRTQIAELQKALPNCDITSNPSLTKDEKGTPSKNDGNTGTKLEPRKLTAEEEELKASVIGEYEFKNKMGTNIIEVFQANGDMEWHNKDKKHIKGKWKWKIVGDKMHMTPVSFNDKEGTGLNGWTIFKINKDRSITSIALIEDGIRADLSEKEQDTIKRIK